MEHHSWSQLHETLNLLKIFFIKIVLKSIIRLIPEQLIFEKLRNKLPTEIAYQQRINSDFAEIWGIRV